MPMKMWRRWSHISNASDGSRRSSGVIADESDLEMLDLSPHGKAKRVSAARASLLAFRRMSSRRRSTLSSGSQINLAGQMEPRISWSHQVTPPPLRPREEWTFCNDHSRQVHNARPSSSHQSDEESRVRSPLSPTYISLNESPNSDGRLSNDALYADFPLHYNDSGSVVAPPQWAATHYDKLKENYNFADKQNKRGSQWSVTRAVGTVWHKAAHQNRRSKLLLSKRLLRAKASEGTWIGKGPRKLETSRTSLHSDSCQQCDSKNSCIKTCSLHAGLNNITGVFENSRRNPQGQSVTSVVVDTFSASSEKFRLSQEVSSATVFQFSRTDAAKYLVQSALCAGTFLFRDYCGLVVLSCWDGVDVQHFAVNDGTRSLPVDEFTGEQFQKFLRMMQNALPFSLQCLIIL